MNLVVGWSLTKLCNLRCIHCYGASGQCQDDELSFSECINVVDKLKEADVAAINFGGGECALREDFINLCKYIYDKEIKISYTTNGTNAAFSRIRDHLGLFHDIGVSIDFANSDEHDKFRARQGVFNEASKTLECLVKNKVDNEIVTCLNKKNSDKTHLKQLYNFANDLGVDFWRLNRFRANGRGKENEFELALTQEELKRAYTFLNQYTSNENIVSEPLFRAAFGGKYCIPGDPSGVSAFRIQSNGEVTPSVFLSISGGNIKNNSIDKILNSETFSAAKNRKSSGKCINCPAYEHCRGGDSGASFLAYGHFNGPDPLCWLKEGEVSPNIEKIIPRQWNVHELYLCTLYLPIKGGTK